MQGSNAGRAPWRRMWRSPALRCNSIHPGAILTPAWNRMQPHRAAAIPDLRLTWTRLEKYHEMPSFIGLHAWMLVNSDGRPCCLHTAGATGSIPVPPTKTNPSLCIANARVIDRLAEPTVALEDRAQFLMGQAKQAKAIGTRHGGCGNHRVDARLLGRLDHTFEQRIDVLARYGCMRRWAGASA